MSGDVWLFPYGTLQQEHVQRAPSGVASKAALRVCGEGPVRGGHVRVSAYKRIAVRLKCGLEAFVYVARGLTNSP